MMSSSSVIGSSQSQASVRDNGATGAASKEPKSSNLESALLGLSTRMTPVQVASLRGMLSNVVQTLCPEGRFPEDPQQRMRFRNVLKVLGTIQGHARMTPNGVCYRGRPDFMTDDYLAAIQREAAEVVRPRALWQRGHMLGLGGPLADELARSTVLRDLVEEHAGPVVTTEIASYLFYDEEGAGLRAHVDTDVFSLNVNIMLRHDAEKAQKSHLFIFSVDGKTREEVLLSPGEIIITFGDSIVHGRAPLAAGETVSILTIGFQPAVWE